jgi:hypothetical protein
MPGLGNEEEGLISSGGWRSHWDSMGGWIDFVLTFPS